MKRFNYLTGKEYQQTFVDFIWAKKRLNNAMTIAGNQPFRIANSINIGYFNGQEMLPRSVTKRNKASYSNNNIFCLT